FEAPSCGSKIGFGLLKRGCEPACGCEVNSCDSACDPCGKSRGGLLSKMFSGKRACDSGCDSGCEVPACGGCEVASCDSGCDSGCGVKRPGLLTKLFGNVRSLG